MSRDLGPKVEESQSRKVIGVRRDGERKTFRRAVDFAVGPSFLAFWLWPKANDQKSLTLGLFDIATLESLKKG